MDASGGLGLAAIERCGDAWEDLHAGSPPLRPRRSAGAGRALPGGPAGAGGAQERLATRGGDGRGRPARGAAPAERRRLGRRRRPRRPPGLRRRPPRRRGERRPHRRRDRLPEEGDEVLRRGAPVHRHGRRHRELPGRRLPGVRVGTRGGLHRPRPLPAAGMDGGPGAPDRGGRPRGDRLRDQDRAGAADARAGVRGGRARAVGRGRCLLRPVARVAAVARGAGPRLRADDPEDQRGLVPGAPRTGRAAGGAAVPDAVARPVGVPGAVRGVRRRDAALAARPVRRGGPGRAPRTSSPTARKRRRSRSWSASARRAGRSRSASRRRRARSAWTSTRCANGRPGTATPRSACWPTPTWSSCAGRRGGKNAGKRGRRSRADPAHGAGGAPAGARDGRSRRAAAVPARLVAVAAGPPGGRRPLPRRAAGAPARTRPPPARAAPPPAAAEAGLTDAEWRRVAPVLPPQKPTRGGRATTTAPCSPASSGWCAPGPRGARCPTEYGKWETAYKRYRLWCATGLWQRILAALPEGER